MTERSPHPIQQGADLALALPVALLRRLRRRLPAVAQHLSNSRAVGKIVVDRSMSGLAKRPPDPSDHTTPPTESSRSAPIEAVDDHVAEVPPAPSAIADYASLAASQVVPRLAALTDSEVDEVAAYEMATRRRRTILAAVERRQS